MNFRKICNGKWTAKFLNGKMVIEDYSSERNDSLFISTYERLGVVKTIGHSESLEDAKKMCRVYEKYIESLTAEKFIEWEEYVEQNK